MSNKDTSGGAFPSSHFWTGENWTDGGLTKREYFAGLAMQGMISARWNERLMEADALAGLAVKHADALLLALEKSP